MKGKYHHLLFLGLAAFLVLAAGCQKKGCTDSNATNYDTKATEDCCCQYSRFVFYDSSASYYDVTSKRTYIFDSAKVWVNGDSGMIRKAYPSTPPDCDGAGTFTYQSTSADGGAFSIKIRVFFKNGYYLDDGSELLGFFTKPCIRQKVF